MLRIPHSFLIEKSRSLSPICIPDEKSIQRKLHCVTRTICNLRTDLFSYSFILRVTSNHRVRCCRDAAATSRRESQYTEHGSIAVFLRIYNTSAAPPSAHLPPDTHAPSQTFAPDLSLNRKFLAITGIRRA